MDLSLPLSSGPIPSDKFNPFFYEPRPQKYRKSISNNLKNKKYKKQTFTKFRQIDTSYVPVKCNLLLSILPESSNAAEYYAIYALKYIYLTFEKRFKAAIKACDPIYLSYSTRLKADFLQGHRLAYIAAFIREYRLRWLFKCFYNRWRLSKFAKFSDVDPITLSEPLYPVYLYDSSHKKKYVFDGHAILTHITAQLFTQRDGFAIPQIPKNPLTNTPFLTQQIRSIYLQLRSYNLINWQLMLYHSNKYCMQRFVNSASVILTKHAIKNDVYNYTDEDAIEMFKEYVLDLIDECHFLNEIVEIRINTLFKMQPNCDFLNYFRTLYVDEKWAQITNKIIRQDIVSKARVYLSNNINKAQLNKIYRLPHNIDRNFGCLFIK